MTGTIPSQDHKIEHLIAAMSGKGGVGTSLVTGLLALILQRQGLRVGILDGDLTGPSMVHMFGNQIELCLTEGDNLGTMMSKNGIKIVSMSMFLENETDPTVWHETMIASAFKQFYSEVAWGDLDYLLVDVPAGTSDVPMTALRSLPLEGVIVVSSPQELATVAAKKCINMIHQYNVPILGIIENMTYFMAPGGEYCEIFGSGKSTELATMAGAPVLARLPLDPRLTALCDAGRIEEYDTEAYAALWQTFAKIITVVNMIHNDT